MHSIKKLLIVGAFPHLDRKIYGGQVRACQMLMQSSFADCFEIIPIDSTQLTNPPPGFLVRAIMALRRVFILLIKLIRSRPDAVLLFVAVGSSVAEKGFMTMICRLLRFPVLVFPRAGELIEQTRHSKIMRLVTQMGIGRATTFICQGPRFQEFAVHDLGFPLASAPVVSNWTATDQLLSIGRERNHRASNKCQRILFLGWLEEFKGVNELLEACKMLHDARHEFHLTFAGDGHAKAVAVEFVKQHGFSEKVSFLGWVPRSALAELLAGHQIFVLPSWAEGFPNALIEAMAAGLAAVVTPVGMITDFIQDEKHALLVSTHNVNLLKIALERLIVDEELRITLARNAHQLAMKEFSVEPAMRKLREAIENAIENQGKIE